MDGDDQATNYDQKQGWPFPDDYISHEKGSCHSNLQSSIDWQKLPILPYIMLSAGGGCMAAATARCRCAWGKFRENLPLLTSKPVPFDLRGRLFSSNVRSSMLHGTETWPMTSAALHRLCRNDCAMIRWICGVKPSDDPSMDELHAKLGICDLAILVRERRLRWFGHVMRSNGEINRVRSRPVPGRKGPGRPKKTWEECVKQDLKVCGLSEAGTQDRLSWRSSVKNSRQEPTPSNGSLLQSMAAPPARRVLGMRTRSFNKTGFDWLIDWYYEVLYNVNRKTDQNGFQSCWLLTRLVPGKCGRNF